MNLSSFLAFSIGGYDMLGIVVIASCLVWPIAVIWFFKFMHWTIQGDLDWTIGLPALVVTILMAGAVTWLRHPIFSPLIAVGMLVALVAMPFVNKLMSSQLHKSIDRQLMMRSVRVACTSSSKAPMMGIATAMYQAGYGDWAVALADQALEEMPELMFPHEHGMARAWRQMGYTADRATALTCLQCGRRNGPQNVVCSGCTHPYLVDHATGSSGANTTLGRKLIGMWCVVMLLLVGIPSAAAFLENQMTLAIVIGVLVAVAGWISWRAFFADPDQNI